MIKNDVRDKLYRRMKVSGGVEIVMLLQPTRLEPAPPKALLAIGGVPSGRYLSVASIFLQSYPEECDLRDFRMPNRLVVNKGD